MSDTRTLSSTDPHTQEWEGCLTLAAEHGLNCLHLTGENLDPAVSGLIPTEVMLNYKIFPLAVEGEVLTLAMADPLDVVAEDVVRYITHCRIIRVVAPESEIKDAIEGRLGHSETLLDSILQRIPEAPDLQYAAELEGLGSTPTPEGAEDLAPIIQLVSSIIGDAIRMKASDIHVEPQKNSLRVRYRVDGYLRTIVELPKRIQNACLVRLKLIARIDISECRRPQDGRARVVLESGHEVDLRVSSLPTYHGEKIVLRILDPGSVVVGLDRLGFNPTDYQRITDVLACSQGMLLCTGPTGSGKSSTLYSALLRLNQDTDNVVTVEDPIEYQLEGINQVGINVKAGLTFASALRSILRQDPDVVLIGEMRDLETAEIAVQAAQTGHLVLSTLHTNDAVSTVGRLILMGLAPYMVASSLLCVVAQRLVRRLCPHCRCESPLSERARRLLTAAGASKLPSPVYTAPGCELCGYQGYKGRLGLFEILLVTDRIREMLMAGAPEHELEKVARSQGMKSLLEDGLAKVGEGLTSVDEVLTVVTIREAGTQVEEAPPTPVREALPSLLPPPPAPPRPDVEDAPRVVFVSPDGDLRHQMAQRLVDSGPWRVAVAEDVSTALGMIHSHRPDLVIVDSATPGLNPKGFVHELRKRLETFLTQIVLLTERGAHLDAGADDYLFKPLDWERLIQRTQEALGRIPRTTHTPELGLVSTVRSWARWESGDGGKESPAPPR